MTDRTQAARRASHEATTAPAHAAPQRTLAEAVSLAGPGLFNAQHVTITFKPAEQGTGLVFVRTDLKGRPRIPAIIDHAEHRERRTAVRRGEATVELVEHALAALVGMGVHNCEIELDGPEPPMGDGSASHFVEAIESVGLREQNAPAKTIDVRETLTAQHGHASITALPATAGVRGLDIVYRLSFDNDSPIPEGAAAVTVSPDTFARELAPARTFSSEAEALAARDAGMFGHIEPGEVLVFGDHGPIGTELRFADEPARHKLLDIVGDLALAGAPIRGRIVAHRSGHTLNRELARKLRDQATRDERAPSPLDARRIREVLPHRYPMLLVDRVLENDGGNHAVGIKNVTINEPFFQGHYPANPIMPGVLVIEAMGQLAGLMLSERLGFDGKIALLLGLEGVKLRRTVVPGDQLRLEANTKKLRPRLAEVDCTASVDGEVAAEARIRFLVVDESFDRR